MTVTEAGAGLHFRITAGQSAAELIRRLEDCGLRIRPIGGYFPGEDGAAENRVKGYENQFVVSYANADPEKLENF